MTAAAHSASRSALIEYVLAAEKRGGDPLTMGGALAELLADISEGARQIGTILQSSDPRAFQDAGRHSSAR